MDECPLDQYGPRAQGAMRREPIHLHGSALFTFIDSLGPDSIAIDSRASRFDIPGAAPGGWWVTQLANPIGAHSFSRRLLDRND